MAHGMPSRSGHDSRDSEETGLRAEANPARQSGVGGLERATIRRGRSPRLISLSDAQILASLG